MPPSSPDSSAGADFMEEFYAECDDYLVEIRRGLLKLEDQVGELSLDKDSLERVFRSFHSLKGICGMAGLQEAEKLAHRAEDYLRALTRQETVLTEQGLNILSSVAETLEQLVLAHRHDQPPIDIAPLLSVISGLAAANVDRDRHSGSPAQNTPGYSPQLVARCQAARDQGMKLFRCFFKPSPELDAQGVNVSAVRTQLGALGKVLHAAPKVQSEGELLFEFVLASPSDPPADILPSANVQFEAFDLPEIAAPHVSAASPNAFVARSHFVRVHLSRLDELMRIMGEMVVHRARLEDALAQIAGALPARDGRKLQEITHGFTRELRHLRDGLMRARMVPISEVFDRLPFVVRDLAREYRKTVELDVKGQETELDKYLVERLKDPLLHLVRNAVSHGIEAPEERAARGKSPHGTITLRASTSGETVLIEVADDGQGIDPAGIAERARAHGLDVSTSPDTSELLDLLCTPGFSTREQADLGAGRGVGMGAVKNAIQELGGDMDLISQPGGGSAFRLRVPLTVAVTDALIISAGGQKFAMPQVAVQEITTAEETAINRFEQNEIVKYRSGVLPLLRLTSVFGLRAEPRPHFPVLVIGTGLNAVGIVADRVIGHREIVVRPVNDPLLKVPGISGATELGDGRAVLILDSASLAQNAKTRQRAAQARTSASGGTL